jgi:hypothetical protein
LPSKQNFVAPPQFASDVQSTQPRFTSHCLLPHAAAQPPTELELELPPHAPASASANEPNVSHVVVQRIIRSSSGLLLRYAKNADAVPSALVTVFAAQGPDLVSRPTTLLLPPAIALRRRVGAR